MHHYNPGIHMNFNTKFLIPVLLLVQLIFSQDESWKVYDDSEVAVIEITVAQSAVEWMYENVESDSMQLGSIRFRNAYIDETIDSVGIRLRGNTSRHSAKKSFKVDFNEFIKGRDFFGIEKLNLNGEHNDPSIIRSKLCWDLMNKAGMIATRAAHAAIYINGSYYGLYISVEHIDEEFIEKRIPDDSGNLWKCLYPADLTYRGTEASNYHPYFDESRPYELQTNEEEYDYSQLARLIATINQTPGTEFTDSLESIFNVKEVLQYFAMNVLLGSWDDYWSLMNNYYLYYEPAADIFHFIPYDYDNTFGIEWWDFDWANIDIYEYGKVDDGSRPLAERIMNVDTYRDLYTHFLEFYNNRIFEHSLWQNELIGLYNLIRPFAVNDPYRTLDYGFTMNDFDRSYSANYNNQHVKRGVQEFTLIKNNSVKDQVEYLDAPPIVYDITYEPKNPGPEDSIKVYSSCFGSAGLEDVKIVFHPGQLTVVEYYPMEFSPVEGSTIIEENDRWVGTILPLGEGGYGAFEIQVEDSKSQVGIYPKKGRIKIAAPSSSAQGVVINEFLADNETVNTDPNGDYEDWVELYNPEPNPISLSGKYMTDDKENLIKWRFPEGISIEPESFLLIWLDEDTDEEGIHAGFKLDKEGEFIALVNEDGINIIDSLSFDQQKEDTSYGRNPDGSETWSFLTPTPGESNEAVTSVDDKIVNEFSLYQNYPNPFNPSTTIKYTIPLDVRRETSYVRLVIYDILGREIKTLINKPLQPGSYEVEFNGSGLPSGVYMYRLNAEDNSSVRKMILIK